MDDQRIKGGAALSFIDPLYRGVVKGGSAEPVDRLRRKSDKLSPGDEAGGAIERLLGKILRIDFEKFGFQISSEPFSFFAASSAARASSIGSIPPSRNSPREYRVSPIR